MDRKECQHDFIKARDITAGGFGSWEESCVENMLRLNIIIQNFSHGAIPEPQSDLNVDPPLWVGGNPYLCTGESQFISILPRSRRIQLPGQELSYTFEVQKN